MITITANPKDGEKIRIKIQNCINEVEEISELTFVVMQLMNYVKENDSEAYFFTLKMISNGAFNEVFDLLRHKKEDKES